MFFKVDIIKNTQRISRPKLLYSAVRKIKLYQMGTAENKLNAYCLNIYKMPLKVICINIIAACKIQLLSNSELVVTISNKKWNNIAQLVTYGNRTLQGSPILQNAFKQYKKGV